ncbi:hypothetical protein [[Eubacterium] cellulosolvens]
MKRLAQCQPLSRLAPAVERVKTVEDALVRVRLLMLVVQKTGKRSHLDALF